MTNYTPQNRNDLQDLLSNTMLSSGLGTKDAPCAIAAVNLALNGRLTDDIPDCMSMALGRATIVLQDAMPTEMRNSARFKRWLLDAPGTGRDREGQRAKVILDWMWTTVLPRLQGLADEGGFGDEWRTMCRERTADAARAAVRAAAVYAARAGAYAASDAASAARAGAYVARAGAYAASDAAYAARAVARAGDDVQFWEAVDPIGVLERMTYLEDDQ